MTRILLPLLLALCLPGCFMASHPAHRFDPTTRHTTPPEPPTDGAIFQAGRGMELFADLKARHVGDVLTIKLQESTNATKNAVTKTSKTTSLANTGPTLFGKTYTNNGVPLLNAALDGKHSFDGGGSSTQSNSLAGSITVTVVDVQSNGNLVVQGEKSLQLNQGEEYVRIAGVVRPADIATDNTVGSDKIADARISYSGKGAISASNRMGWLARFFNSPVAPF
ncbi:MAG: flagellar basal body L-ring protein FlgH [Steroidobacteraceae bacterium]